MKYIFTNYVLFLPGITASPIPTVQIENSIQYAVFNVNEAKCPNGETISTNLSTDIKTSNNTETSEDVIAKIPAVVQSQDDIH